MALFYDGVTFHEAFFFFFIIIYELFLYFFDITVHLDIVTPNNFSSQFLVKHGKSGNRMVCEYDSYLGTIAAV